MTPETLRSRWDAHPNWKHDWQQFTESDLWKHLTSMVSAEALRDARLFSPHMDADTAVARKLIKLDGIEAAIDKLNAAAFVKKPEPPEDDESAEYRRIANEVYSGPVKE